jgi:hypothetical protein
MPFTLHVLWLFYKSVGDLSSYFSFFFRDGACVTGSVGGKGEENHVCLISETDFAVHLYEADRKHKETMQKQVLLMQIFHFCMVSNSALHFCSPV